MRTAAQQTAGRLSSQEASRHAPSPEEILRRLRLPARTRNTLRRYLAHAPASAEPWTYGRLLDIPGFGQRALDDVLDALESQGAARLRRARPHRYLEDEIAELSATRPRGGHNIGTPLLDRAVALVAQELPASEVRIAQRLVQARVARGPVELAAIERAARFAKEPPPFAVLRREGFVLALPPSRVTFASTVYGLAVRSVVNWGMALVRRIAFQANSEDLPLVLSIVSAKDNFSWLDEPVGWFWYHNDRNPLLRGVEKVLQVAGSVHVDDLARALFRRWAPENVPSRKALDRLCSQHPCLQVDDGKVTFARRRGRVAPLSDAERTVIALLRRHGPELPGHRLPEIGLDLGMTSAELARHLRASPFVTEPHPGVFRLIGS
jgi:hypothetical protein